MHNRSAVVVSSVLLLGFCASAGAQNPVPQNACPVPNVWPKELIPPKNVKGQNEGFNQALLNYVKTGCYRTAEGWRGDKAVRGTGPFTNGTNWGTHYASVRIWYSPEVVHWLDTGRQGDIADGGIIIKEQYQPPGGPAPPACFQYMDEQALTSPANLSDWSIMLKRNGVSKDGWYWVEVWDGMTFPEIGYPKGGFGEYCLRCHASAEKESTFSATENIKGYPGQYLTFLQDDSWRSTAGCQPQSPPSLMLPLQHAIPLSPETPETLSPRKLERLPSDHEKHRLMRDIRRAAGEERQNRASICQNGPVACMVSEAFDRTVSSADHPGGFVTSDQCLGCHSTNWNWMFISIPNNDNTGVNVSPYGEWRWSPMGLAGRDPIFYAQVESELAYIDTIQDPIKRKKDSDFVKNTCFHCHGVMGQRQFAQEHPDDTFDPNFVNHRESPYGGLARDGISCTVCHRIKDTYSSLDNFLNKETTGNFDLIAHDDIEGPFEDNHIVVDPMKNGLGYTPKYNAYTTSSRLCGSCHVINLPVVDDPKGNKFSLEQNTYVEWLNSQYENEFSQNNPKAQTCQDCHMRDSYVSAEYNLNVSPLPTKIAVIEDETYPAATNREALDKITVTYRSKGFRRHELVGLNGFLLNMFSSYMMPGFGSDSGNFYNYILGVRKADYMSNLTDDLPNAIGNMVQQAQTTTASISTNIVKAAGQQLIADVTVQNQTGHRFPSGVGFRRAFIQFQALDQTGKAIWTSGATDSHGVILGPGGKPLPTEFFLPGPDGKQQYQDHHDVQHPITSETQVQIYEELNTDADGKITTSFIRRDEDLKDNRLLPQGWREDAPIPQPYLHATYPVGRAMADPIYHNGLGQSIVRYQIQLPAGVDASKVVVRATLYYQTIPPYYLQQRYDGAPNGPGTKRLKYLVENMNLNGSPFANWKLMISQPSSAGAPIGSVSHLAFDRGDKVPLETTNRGNIIK